MRVTSTEPDWLWDQATGILYIHNPIERYQCAVTCYFPYDSTRQLTHVGCHWVKRYALEKSRYQYGDILAKYDNAIPGPVKDLRLDNSKRANAEARILKLEEEVKGMQITAGLQLD